jgi:hypothetical protein
MFKSRISRPNRIRFSKISCYRPLGPNGFGFSKKSQQKNFMPVYLLQSALPMCLAESRTGDLPCCSVATPHPNFCYCYYLNIFFHFSLKCRRRAQVFSFSPSLSPSSFSFEEENIQYWNYCFFGGKNFIRNQLYHPCPLQEYSAGQNQRFTLS